MAKRGRGQPRIIKSVEEMQEKINKYFEDCKGKPILDADGNYILDKHGRPIFTQDKPLTVTGLALALGFNSRQTLLNYQGEPEYMDTIMRAKSQIEEYVEMRLFDKEGSTGAKFNLSNNFKGWREKQEIEQTNVNIEMPKEDIEAELERLGFKKS